MEYIVLSCSAFYLLYAVFVEEWGDVLLSTAIGCGFLIAYFTIREQNKLIQLLGG